MKNARLSLRRVLVVALVAPLCLAGSGGPASAVPEWLSSVVAASGTPEVGGYDVAVLPDDTTVVVWSAEDGSGAGTIQFATRGPGDASFSVAEPLSDTDAGSPQIVVDGQGAVTAAWIQKDDDDTVHVRRLAAGASEWSPADPASTDSATEFQLLVDRAEKVTVVSSHAVGDPEGVDPVLYRVEATTRPAGGSWSGAREVAGETAEEIGQMRAVVDGSGTVSAVWTQGSATSLVRVAWGDVASGFDSVALGSTGAHAPDVAPALDGGLAVSWAEPVGDREYAIAASRAAGGLFSTPEPVSGGGQTPVTDTEIVVGAAGTTVLYAGQLFGEYAVTVSTRPPGGDDFFPALLDYNFPGTSVAITALELVAAPDGALTALWQSGDSPSESASVSAAHAAAGEEFSLQSTVPIALGGRNLAPAAAVDSLGDVTLVWESLTTGTTSKLMSRVLDSAGPRLDMTVPGTALPGTVVPMAATATEHWSGPATLAWEFGDGATSTSAVTSHVYAAGTYQVTVTATDRIGNTTTRTRSLVVAAPAPSPAPPAPPPVPRDGVAPVLSKAQVLPKTLPAPGPAKVRVTSSEAARVVAVVDCRPEGRWKRVARKQWSVTRGANTEKLLSSAAQRRLENGACRVRLDATDPAGNESATTSIRFRVDRG